MLSALLLTGILRVKGSLRNKLFYSESFCGHGVFIYKLQLFVFVFNPLISRGNFGRFLKKIYIKDFTL